MSFALFLPFTNGAAYGIRMATCLTIEEARGSPYAGKSGAILIKENGETSRQSCLPLEVLEQARVELPAPPREPQPAAADERKEEL